MLGRAAIVFVLGTAGLGCGEDAVPESDTRDARLPDADVGSDTRETVDSERETHTDADVGDVDARPDTSRPDVGDGALSLACDESSLCVVDCARGVCRDGLCDFAGPKPTASGCVIAEPDAPDLGRCMPAGAPRPDEPACFFCNPDVSAAEFVNIAFADGFEAGGAQIAVERLVATPATWVISSARAASGTRALYFGDPASQSYDVGERAAAVARSLPLEVPSAARLTLTFQIFAASEGTPGYDRVRVLLESGEEVRELWTSDAVRGDTGGVFVPIVVEVGAVAPGARLAFEADTIDGIINAFEGFYLDDIRLATTCCDASAPDAARDCDDANPCTIDACAAGDEGGVCSHAWLAGCCLSDGGCDDGDPCTADHCSAPGGTCEREPIAGCCDDARDCDDRDPCTEDRCDGVACSHAPICCASDGDCDDGDPCTSGRCEAGQCRYVSTCCDVAADCDDGQACTDDRCEGGVCKNAFTYAPGCCLPDVLTEGFDGSAFTPDGWALSPIVNNVGWQVLSSAESRSEPRLLYYGHKTLGFYETGSRNSGSVATPFVRLPDGVELELSFAILADVEANPTRDTFEVQAVVGTGTVTLLTKADIALGAWQDVTIDLGFAAGELVQLRFVFDTIDAVQNTRRGVYLDDIRVLSTCLPLPE